MKLTLRKAARLRNKISKKLADLRFVLRARTQTSVNIYDLIPEDVLVKEQESIEKDLKSFKDLSLAYAELRHLLAVANAEAGIAKELATLNAVETQLDVINQFINAEPRPDGTVISSRIKGARERAQVAAAAARETLEFPVLTGTLIEELKRYQVELDARITSIHDKMEEINSVNVITLSSETEETLRQENLL